MVVALAADVPPPAGVNSSLFSLSLPRVFQRGRRADFVNVEGLPGIYIANFLGLNALEDSAFRYDAEAADYEEYLKSMASPAHRDKASCCTCGSRWLI